ncbi:unnamed protein product [Rotaria socialis]
MVEFLIGQENVIRDLPRGKSNEYRNIQKSACLYFVHGSRVSSKDHMKLYQHSVRCTVAMTIEESERPEQRSVQGISFTDELTWNLRQMEDCTIYVESVPKPSTGYIFSNRQIGLQLSYFNKKRDKDLPNQAIDLYNATIVAVLPETCSEMLRLTVESLFITHAETKLNTIGNILNKNSTGNTYPLNSPWLSRGDEWYQGLLRRPQPKNYLDISFEMSSTSASVSTAAIVPSSVSSSNTGQQLISSPSTQPRVCRCPYQELCHLESIWTDTNLNGIQYSEQHQTTVQTAQSANQLQHLHVNSDNNPIERAVAINNVSPHPLWVHHEMLAENGLIDRFKEVINDFIQRPGRQYAYDANMRWSIEHCNEIRFSVAISIKEPTDIVAQSRHATVSLQNHTSNHHHQAVNVCEESLNDVLRIELHEAVRD